jgi:hypothetical protein
VVGNPAEHARQPSLRVAAVELGGLGPRPDEHHHLQEAIGETECALLVGGDCTREPGETEANLLAQVFDSVTSEALHLKSQSQRYAIIR